MSQNLDKNKLKEKIQKTPSKDLLYLIVGSIESRPLNKVFEQIEKFSNKRDTVILVLRT